MEALPGRRPSAGCPRSQPPRGRLPSGIDDGRVPCDRCMLEATSAHRRPWANQRVSISSDSAGLSCGTLRELESQRGYSASGLARDGSHVPGAADRSEGKATKGLGHAFDLLPSGAGLGCVAVHVPWLKLQGVETGVAAPVELGCPALLVTELALIVVRQVSFTLMIARCHCSW